MDFRVVIAGIVCLAAFLCFVRLLPKNDNLHRNLKVWQVSVSLAVLAGIIIFCLAFLGKKIYRNGVGGLFTDYGEMEARSQSRDEETGADGGGDGALTIVVKLDQIQIGDSAYTEPSEAGQVIADAVSSGKKIRVVDDYAAAATYNDLIHVITQMNVSRSSIEEIMRP